jgi:hypothetical protein
MMSSELITAHLLLKDQDGVTDGPAGLRESSPDGTRRAWLPPFGQKTEKLPDGNGGDSGPGGRGGAIRLVRGGRGDPQDDAVAVLGLEREGLAWRAESDRDAERAAEKRMERINDGDRQV